MSFLDDLKKKLAGEIDGSAYFRRNSGKKMMATILEPTEGEIKSLEAEQ